MTEVELKDLFQNQIMKEAKEGCVNIGDAVYNVHFTDENREDDYVPFLEIRDEQAFYDSLTEYYTKASAFYRDDSHLKNLKEEEQAKLLITTLFSNAATDDFKDPVLFLQKRCSFFEDDLSSKYSSPQIIGKYPLDSTTVITMQIRKQSLLLETPYQAEIRIAENASLGGSNYLQPPNHFLWT